MPQFDVYLNPQAAARNITPYVVDMQSAFVDLLPTRLVAPLSRLGSSQLRLPVNLCPSFAVGDETLMLRPYLAAPMDARLLGKPIASLKQRGSELIAAFDAVLSGM
jgi:toxin CcdB